MRMEFNLFNGLQKLNDFIWKIVIILIDFRQSFQWFENIILLKNKDIKWVLSEFKVQDILSNINNFEMFNVISIPDENGSVLIDHCKMFTIDSKFIKIDCSLKACQFERFCIRILSLKC